MSSAAVFQLEGVFKSYGQVLGLNDVSLSLGPGIHGLLGPNGAGKSTLMKILAGQLKADRGRAWLRGRPVWNCPAGYLELGFCPEQDAFPPGLSGRGFLSALAELHGLRRGAAPDAAGRALERVGLEPAVWARPIASYSKGMRQRLKLAQALLHEPAVLILDEPLGGLDPVGRQRLLELMTELVAGGRTLLVSSHILHEIESMTSSVVLMVNGRVAAEGNVHEIRALIDRHPHRIALRCPEPRRLAAALVENPDVVSLELASDPPELHLTTRRPDQFYPRLTEAVLALGLEVERLSSPDDNLEAVYRYLIDEPS
ncbi:MAG TPA: ABC transporter ATP-binding protein [Acidobacteriota bacterium]